MKRTILFLLILFSISSNIFSLSNFFLTIDGKDGLSHNNIKSMIQDSYGFMWFGTRNKLNRYDGISIKVFDCYDSDSGRRNNNISALFESLDKKLWLGTDNGIFIFDPIHEKFTSFDLEAGNKTTITQWVADIREDSNGNIWIIVPNQGVFKYNASRGKLKHYTVVEKLQPSVSNPQSISIDKRGRVWIGTNGSGVFLYDNSNDSFIQYTGNDNAGESLLDKNIYTMCHYNDDLIVGVHEGCLMKLDMRKNSVSSMHIPEIDYKIIRHITVYDNILWVATQAGLVELNLNTNRVKHTKEDSLNPYSLSDNFVEKIYKDNEGGIWVATNFGGANHLPNRNNKFEKYLPNSYKSGSVSKRIREIKEDAAGNIWLGTEDAGVMTFDPQTQEFKQLASTQNKKTLAMLAQGSKIWVGYFKDGLDIIETSTNAISHYSAQMLGIDEGSIYALCEDRHGKVWLGNAWGVFVCDRNEMKFERLDIFGLCYTYDILEDSEGYIWVATMGSGVFQYNQTTKEIKHFTHRGENSLSSNTVSSITEDHLGQLWFSTDRGGVCIYNKQKNEFTSYSIRDGLPDDIVYKVVEDKDYNIWFGTNSGLVKFDPHSHIPKIYTQSDGLLSERFNYKSGIISRTGKLYFGSMEGLVAFKPDEFKENNFIPPVYITKLSIFNKEVSPGSDNNIPIPKSIIHTDKIELKHDQSNISFDFVSLSYTSPMSNTYAYRMEDIDKDWIYTKNNHSASYAKLPPGKYIFKVRGSNNDGLWNDKETAIEITILPPWWKSIMAYIVYFILLALGIYLSVKYYAKKYSVRNEEKQRLFEIRKEKELYESKVNFFTDIAHEIRTPITLINGPLESIIEQNIDNDDIKYNLSIIEKNTKHLLTLINQLLDFRKVDSNRFTLHQRRIDINQLLDSSILRFEKEINSSKKKINVSKDDENPIFALVDKEAISKIISNLLSNAVKYSSKTIDIVVDSDSEYFTIQVSNDGEAVPEEYREKIFEPFFQVKSQKKESLGSGIGLSLARSLAEIHDGYLFYEYQQDQNIFHLKIPLGAIEVIVAQPTEVEDNTEYFIEPEKSVNKNMQPQTILLVEDNEDMLNFISNRLRSKYSVELASNGREALQVLAKKTIDIVISDIMMPQMDGFELCQYIKESDEYSHIIVVLLTAKNDLPSKIEGLEKGADAYLEKPFSFTYLETLLATLVSNRQRSMETFLKKPFIPMQQSGLNKADEVFLNTITELINENITDSNLNVERLADLLRMSRSSLHRKLKSLTDATPSDFIRLVRLQRAAQIIQEGQYRINEVCYLIGINSPSYFSKLFHSQYGMTPKEFEKQVKSEKPR